LLGTKGYVVVVVVVVVVAVRHPISLIGGIKKLF
jgi:hypothetical protein